MLTPSNEETENIITCNNQPDQTFVEEAVSVRPCTLQNEDIYFGDSEENFEDEDDSEDENHWRNDYPEEIDTEKEEDSDDSYYDDTEVAPYYREVAEAYNEFDIDLDDDETAEHSTLYGQAYSKILKKKLKEDDDDVDSDY